MLVYRRGKTTSIYIFKHTFQYTGWFWGMICNHLKQPFSRPLWTVKVQSDDDPQKGSIPYTMNCVRMLVKVPSEMTSEEQTKSLFYRPSLESMEENRKFHCIQLFHLLVLQKPVALNLKNILAFAPPPQISLQGVSGCLQWVKNESQSRTNSPIFWSNYSDRKHDRISPKWWFSKGNSLISGKSGLVKYFFKTSICWSEKKKPQPKATERQHTSLAKNLPRVVDKALDDAEKVPSFLFFFCETSIRCWNPGNFVMGNPWIHGGNWYSWNFGRWKSCFFVL